MGFFFLLFLGEKMNECFRVELAEQEKACMYVGDHRPWGRIDKNIDCSSIALPLCRLCSNNIKNLQHDALLATPCCFRVPITVRLLDTGNFLSSQRASCPTQSYD